MITAKMAKKIVEREGALLNKPVPNYDCLSLMVYDNAMMAFSNLEVRVIGHDVKEWSARLKKKGYSVTVVSTNDGSSPKTILPKEVYSMEIYW